MMADPLSLAAGAIAVIQHVTTLLPRLRQRGSAQGDPMDWILIETELYTQILKEISQISLWGSSSVPDSAAMCLQACDRSLRDIEEYLSGAVKISENLSKSRKWKLSDLSINRQYLERVLGNFRRYVKLLRDVVMDSLTHQLLENYQVENDGWRRINGPVEIRNVIDANQDMRNVEESVKSFLQQFHEVLGENTRINGPVRVINEFSDRFDPDKDGSENAMAQLRRAVQGMNIPSEAPSTKPNPFEFIAKILHPIGAHQDASRMVCTQLDTGSEKDWMSMALLNRLGLESHLEDVIDDNLYTGVDGNLFKPAGKVSVTWTRNSVKSWQTDFLVVDTSTFDMLLGRKFIVQEGLFVFAEPILATDVSRLAPLSPEDYQKMEQNIRERGAENEELSMTRDAKEKAARQRRRDMKAASRMSLATTPGSRTPSSAMYPPSSN